MTALGVIFAITAAWFVLRAIIVIARIASDRPTPGSPFMILMMIVYTGWLAYLCFTGATFLFVVAMVLFGFAALWLVGTLMNFDNSKTVATGIILTLTNIALGLLALNFA